MIAIIGIIVVFGAVLGGYLMEHGNLKVLVQPAELIIIGGAAVGTVLISNPLHIIKKIIGGIGGEFGGSKFGKQAYIDTLKLMYELLNKTAKDGRKELGDRRKKSDTRSRPRWWAHFWGFCCAMGLSGRSRPT